jgi:hypothetical protein
MVKIFSRDDDGIIDLASLTGKKQKGFSLNAASEMRPDRDTDPEKDGAVFGCACP